MAVQQRKVSQSRRDKRRSHHALEAKTTAICKNCGKSVLPHRVCKYCHHYDGRNINK